MKRILSLAAAVILLTGLCACGGEKPEQQAKEIQERFARAQGCSFEVKEDLTMGETRHYTLKGTQKGGRTTLVVTAPEALAGIAAVVEGDAMRLRYEDLVLDVPEQAGGVCAATCVPILLSAVQEGYLLSARRTETGGAETLCASFEKECGEETLCCRVWFSDGLPLCGEIEKNGEILASMGFTNVEIYDTISP